MFGVLLGTLQRFKKEEDTKSEKDILREKVEEQVKHQVIEEHQQLVDKEREQIQKDKEEQLALKEALTKEIEEKEIAFMNDKWEKQRKLLSNPLFRKTTSQPSIYYSIKQSMKDVKMPPSPNMLSGDEVENAEEEEEEEEEDVVTADNVTVQAVESTPVETQPDQQAGKEEKSLASQEVNAAEPSKEGSKQEDVKSSESSQVEADPQADRHEQQS